MNFNDLPSWILLVIPLVLVQLGLMIYCLLDLLKRENFKLMPKWAWALIIIFGELLGPIFYLLAGRSDE